MASELFDRPVFVKRKHFIQEIGCLDDILDFLEEWPEEKRDITYETMLRACRNATIGRFPLSAVRDNFERFLRKNAMLAEIQDMPSVWQPTDGRNIGGVQESMAINRGWPQLARFSRISFERS